MRRLFIAVCLLAGCAASFDENPGPRALRANDHVAMANREDSRADELQHWPDQRPGADGKAAPIAPWHGRWDTTTEHRRTAAAHRGAAAELDAEYIDACGDAPLEQVSISPLRRFGMGGSTIPNGTLIVLSSDAGSPDKLLAAMRCHRAWMMLGRTGMDDCPLDLPGLHVAARGDLDGIELAITIDDPSLVDELRRRAAQDLEAAQHKAH